MSRNAPSLYAELLFQPPGRNLTSLTILFEIVDQDWSFISDLLLTLTVDYSVLITSTVES